MKRIGKGILTFLPIVICLTLGLLWTSQMDRDLQGVISGTLETRKIDIKLEIGGQVVEVLVKEGDVVRAGEVLLRLENEQIQSQYRLAVVNLDQAMADYQLLASQPMQEQRQCAIAEAEYELLLAQQFQKDLIDDAELTKANIQKELEEDEIALEDLLDHRLQLALAKERIATAEKTKDSSKRRVTILTTPASKEAIDQAYANLLLAKSVLDQTRDDLEWARDKLQGNLGPDIPKEYYIEQYKSEFRKSIQALEIKFARDQLVYDHALQQYESLFEPKDPVEIALAEAALAVAEAELEQAQREYKRVMDGPSKADIAVIEAKIESDKRDLIALQGGADPNDLALAEARVRQAKASLAFAKADTIMEKLEVANAKVESAKASLEILKTQLNKLLITAPCDGILLESRVEVGEIAKPGTRSFTLSRLHQLTTTLYFPEDHYPNVHQNDVYKIQIDAFPDVFFNARVTQKADQDEFLPRNITTKSQGSQAVFAVQMAVEDPKGILKPGLLAHLDLRP